jgi:DNA-binding NarL/FixJ family response regulator
MNAELKFPNSLTILIADDHVLIREGLKSLVAGIYGSVQFLEASDGDALIQMAGSHAPIELALVDLNMPNMDRGVRLNELSLRYPDLPIVVVSALTSPDIVQRMLSISSVYAFVPKSATPEHMQVAMNAAMSRIKLMFSPQQHENPHSDVILTPRLEEVRRLLRQGLTNKHIAMELGISEGTVKNYLSEIFRALKVTNRTQAAQINAGIS